jgi:hypothetical protein
MSRPAARSSAAPGAFRGPANIVPVSIASACLRLALAVCLLGAAGAQPAPPALAPLAHSALLAVDAAAGAGGVTLRVRRAGGAAPLLVSDVAVTIDNQSRPATQRPDGSWFVPRPAGAEDAGKTIEVTVGHDGIHEILSGRLPPSAAPSGAARSSASGVMSSSHKQLLWWILNIAIVAIAAIAISRRTS